MLLELVRVLSHLGLPGLEKGLPPSDLLNNVVVLGFQVSHGLFKILPLLQNGRVGVGLGLGHLFCHLNDLGLLLLQAQLLGVHLLIKLHLLLSVGVLLLLKLLPA